ncbi:hypothetical protein [Shinella sp.]|uniref:hypothetical protein n=1 Tax=Shinella sp. TaxID=1870904 RepID=UPI0025860C97|nr:hypothetical protein [Shinella sp.]
MAGLKNERDALRKKAKRVSDEKATIAQKAEATAMELDDTKEALNTTQAALATTRKQLNNAKHYRKTVAADKRQAESERDAALEELEQLQTLADERLEAYEELEMEMVMMMMTDDVMAKRKRTSSGGGGGGGGGGGDESVELKDVDFFHEGRYDDNMRVAILACMRAGVGKDRIAPLVAALLRVLANLKVNRMPAPSTIAKWADEMSNLTAIHLYNELTTRMEATKVFAHDGTTMGGKKYGTATYVFVCCVTQTDANECVSTYHSVCSSCGAAFTSIEQLRRRGKAIRDGGLWPCSCASSPTARPRPPCRSPKTRSTTSTRSAPRPSQVAERCPWPRSVALCRTTTPLNKKRTI